MLRELFKLYKIPTEQNLQIQEKKSWGTAAVSLFPKSSTLVLRLSFLQDTILPVFDINKWLLLKLLSETPHHDSSNLLLLLIKRPLYQPTQERGNSLCLSDLNCEVGKALSQQYQDQYRHNFILLPLLFTEFQSVF